MAEEQAKFYGIMSFVFSVIWIVFLSFFISRNKILLFIPWDIFRFVFLFIVFVFPICSVISGILQKKKGQTKLGKIGLIIGIIEILLVIGFLVYYFFFVYPDLVHAV